MSWGLHNLRLCMLSTYLLNEVLNLHLERINVEQVSNGLNGIHISSHRLNWRVVTSVKMCPHKKGRNLGVNFLALDTEFLYALEFDQR